MAEEELSVVSASLDLRIQNFLTTTEEICGFHTEKYNDYLIHFLATVSTHGDGKDWLSVHVQVDINHSRKLKGLYDFKLALSIIDIEGITRFTRYFDICGYRIKESCKSTSLNRFFEHPEFFDDRIPEVTYMEKSFIVNRADELLSDGALFLSCDIYFDFDAIKDFVCIAKPQKLCDMMYKIPFLTSFIKAEDSPSSITVFDFTGQILTLPKFHEFRKRFGVYGISPERASPRLESNEEITDILEHVWIFVTPPLRFLLSLAPNKKNLGRLLVDASPVIRQCINTPMKERSEKRIEFANVDYMTFLIVLNFLKTGELFEHTEYSDHIVEVYKFSHLYEIEKLQQKCAEFIMSGFKTEAELEETEKIAEMYTDVYLFRLLESRKRKILEPSYTSAQDDRTDFDFYK